MNSIPPESSLDMADSRAFGDLEPDHEVCEPNGTIQPKPYRAERSPPDDRTRASDRCLAGTDRTTDILQPRRHIRHVVVTNANLSAGFVQQIPIRTNDSNL